VGRFLCKRKMALKLLALLVLVSCSSCGLVRRDADANPDAKPEANPDADPGYLARGYSSPPQCESVPEKKCVPRDVETPREECHIVEDTIVDTVTTEHCEEVITTSCTQTSKSSSHSSAIVGQDSKVVSSGVVAHHGTIAHHGAIAHHGTIVQPVGVTHSIAGVHRHSYGKRDAEAQPDAEASPNAEAEADADPGYYAGPVVASAPVCTSTPVKKCEKVPVSTPRKVQKTLCKTVVDVTTIEDCEEIITTHCKQTSQQVSHSSAVVGKSSKVVTDPVVVATAHGVVGHAPSVAVRAPVGYHGGLSGLGYHG